MKKKKVLIYTPDLTHYRINVYNNISKKTRLTVVYDSNKKNEKDRSGHITEKKNKKIKFIKSDRLRLTPFYFQKLIVGEIIKNKYDILILSSDIKNLTNYLLNIICKIKKIKVFMWGQGAFNKDLNNIFLKFIYFIYHSFLNIFIEKYICYNRLCSINIKKYIEKKKIRILNNSLEKKIILKNKANKLNSIMFIGRLRKGCSLDILLLAMQSINKKFKNIKLKIVGDGENYKQYFKLAKKLKINCKFYKKKKYFNNLSKNVFVGVYPGAAGLSIVEYFILGLPAITHNEFLFHMGPEPDYLKNNYNGLFFKRNSAKDLSKKIIYLYLNKKKCKTFSNNARNTAIKINTPPISKKFINEIYYKH